MNNQNIDNGIELSSWSCRREICFHYLYIRVMGINDSVHKKMLGLFIIRYYINKSRNLIDNLSCMKCFGWQHC